MLDIPCADDGVLVGADLEQICRLCLQMDDLMICIYDRLDPNPKKRPLCERIFELYQIEISPTDGLSTNICHRCLYYTEQYTEFRDCIRECESRLHNFIGGGRVSGSQSLHPAEDRRCGDLLNAAAAAQQSPLPNIKLEMETSADKIVLVIDPTKDYASSSEDESGDGDLDEDIDSNGIGGGDGGGGAGGGDGSDVDALEPSLQHLEHVHQAHLRRSTINDHDGVHDGGGPQVVHDYDRIDEEDDEDEDGDNVGMGHMAGSDGLSPTYRHQSNGHTMSQQQQQHHPQIPRIHLPVAETAEGFKNLYFCQYCDTAYVDQGDCFDHESSHDAVNPHQCNFCGFACGSRNTVIAHIKECHEPEKPFVCVRCKKRFGRRSDLRKHSIVHTGIRPFGCPVCGKNFSRNTNLTKHLRIHSGLKPHVCGQCPRSFTTRADLLRHMQVHSASKPFQCTLCPATYSRRYKFLHHERTHHGKGLLSDEQQQQQQQQHHMQYPMNHHQHQDDGMLMDGMEAIMGGHHHHQQQYGHHDEPIQLTDDDEDDCDDDVGVTIEPEMQLGNVIGGTSERQRFDSENMVISLDPYHDLNPNHTEDDRFMSPSPMAKPPLDILSSPPNLHRMLQQGPPQMLLAEPTPQTFAPVTLPPVVLPSSRMASPTPLITAAAAAAAAASVSAAAQTSNTVSTGGGGAPNISTFVFQDHIQELAFPGHVTGDAITFLTPAPAAKPKNFPCEHCPKRFATHSSLQNHKNIHMGVRNHVCPICNKCFVRKRELDRHSVIHTGHKPFACTHCAKRFGRKDKLVRHERIHMEERMFACTLCPMTFNRRDGLLLHMRTHQKQDQHAQQAAAMSLLLAQQQAQQQQQALQQQQQFLAAATAVQQQQQQQFLAATPQASFLPPAVTLTSIPPPAPVRMVSSADYHQQESNFGRSHHADSQFHESNVDPMDRFANMMPSTSSAGFLRQPLMEGGTPSTQLLHPKEEQIFC